MDQEADSGTFDKKSKCVIKIVPKDKKVPTFQMDEKCKKRRTK